MGAGSGAVDLLTLRAARLLGGAHAVVHDRLVDHSVLEPVSPSALVVDVGEGPGASSSQASINALLVTLGRSLECVVRLKGGDPFVFGRGGEECEALAAAGVVYEVVPGITSAFAAPLIAGIPVTHRGYSCGVTVVTGRARDGTTVDFRLYANPHVTLVVLMGVERRATIAAQLVEGKLATSTPAAVVERAYTVGQRVQRGSLGNLAGMKVRAPAVLVIGAVARLDVGSWGWGANAVVGTR